MTCPPTVCQLAPCQTDDCPLTGRCIRQWPWRRTPAAVFDLVNPQRDLTIYTEVPPELREKPKGRRLRPYAWEGAEAKPQHLTIPGL